MFSGHCIIHFDSAGGRIETYVLALTGCTSVHLYSAFGHASLDLHRLVDATQ